MTQYTINDSRINRNNNFGYYTELSRELVKTATGMQRDNLQGRTMSWDEFKAVSYMHDNNDVQVDVVLDFNTNAATITVKGDRHQEPEHTNEKPAKPVADFSLEDRRDLVEAFKASDEQTEETEEKETIVYVKYCPNVFVAKCEKEHQKGDIVEIETRSGNVHECEIWNFLGHSRKDGKPLYSITRTDGTNKATIAARRAERRREWAEKAEERSTQYFQRSEDAVAGIVPGQPILVGHHSEKRHRAALDRSWNAMGKSVAESEKAEAHNEKAEYWERKAEDITLDMPESLEYFKEQLAKAEEYHAGVKSGKYPREHAYTLTYAKKRVNEMAEKVKIATKLWGSDEEETATETATETTSTAAEQPTETTTTTAQETAKEIGNAFEVGQTYYSRSMCDYDCIFTVKVLARNGSKLTLENWDGKTIKKMAKKDENGVEFFADGRYSMAPIFRANKKAEDIPHNDDPTPEPDPTGTDPTEQKTDIADTLPDPPAVVYIDMPTDEKTATPASQKSPAPLIATADTSDPAAMKEAAENIREWCNTDQLADPTPYAAEFDNVAALAWAVLNNYTPTEAEQMTAAALQLSAKMQRRANEINEATAAMEEANRQEHEPEQWKTNREEIKQFESYAEDLTMYAEGLAAAVGVPDWQLCDVAAIPEPQDDPAQLAMALIEEKPAPLIEERPQAPVEEKPTTPTEAAPVTDAEVYEQAARIRATYEALKAEAETETPTPSQSKSDKPRSQKSHRLPAVKERKPRAKHSALCRSMLRNMDGYAKGKMIKYGVNLADPSLTVCPKSNKQSTARILKEAKKEGYSVVLVEIYPSYNSITTHFAWLVEGDKWGSDTTKGNFDEYRRDGNTKLYLVKSKTHGVPEKDNSRSRYCYGNNYDPFERLGRPGHDPWMQIGVHIDKSGYRLVNLESRKQEAHRYCADVRRKQEEAAFNTTTRDEAVKKAQSIVDDLRIMFADFILNGGNPHDASWEFEKCTDQIKGWFSMEEAKTDKELQEHIEKFNKAVEEFKKQIQPEEEEAAAKAA